VGDKKDKLQVNFKNLQGQVTPLGIEHSQTIGDVKKTLAKIMNDKEKDAAVKKIHPAQLRLTHANADLEDDKPVIEVDKIEEDFVFVFVGDATKVPITLRVHMFKGTGVEITEVKVTLGDTADAIKDQLIAKSFGPQDKSYTLFYKGRPLLDSKTLQEYNLEEGSQILLGVIM